MLTWLCSPDVCDGKEVGERDKLVEGSRTDEIYV